MVFVRRDPLADLVALQRDLNRLFTGLGVPVHAEGDGDGERASWVPPIDLLRQEGGFLLRADIPGVEPSATELTVTDGVLTIRGERVRPPEARGEGHVVREVTYGRFERRIDLPQGTDAPDIHATSRDGVLEIHVPAAAAQAPSTRRIEIAQAPQGAPRQPAPPPRHAAPKQERQQMAPEAPRPGEAHQGWLPDMHETGAEGRPGTEPGGEAPAPAGEDERRGRTRARLGAWLHPDRED